jgi:energy-coupling factor transporter transmembrane protein EcfT
MSQQTSLNWWERNVLWLIFTLLIAGGWGILGDFCDWTLDPRVVWFATLNIVLTIRFAVGIASKQSPEFHSLFVLVAQITGVWVPVILFCLLPLIFVSFFVSAMVWNVNPFHGNSEKHFYYATTHAGIVGVGTSAVALLTIYLNRRRLLTAPSHPKIP